MIEHRIGPYRQSLPSDRAMGTPRAGGFPTPVPTEALCPLEAGRVFSGDDRLSSHPGRPPRTGDRSRGAGARNIGQYSRPEREAWTTLRAPSFAAAPGSTSVGSRSLRRRAGDGVEAGCPAPDRPRPSSDAGTDLLDNLERSRARGIARSSPRG